MFRVAYKLQIGYLSYTMKLYEMLLEGARPPRRFVNAGYTFTPILLLPDLPDRLYLSKYYNLAIGLSKNLDIRPCQKIGPK